MEEDERTPMEGDTIEVRGRTVDEAIHAALDQLGVTRDDVEIEVLSEGRSGVFGVGSQDARVRVTVIGDEYAEEEDEGPRREVAPYVAEEEEEEEDEGPRRAVTPYEGEYEEEEVAEEHEAEPSPVTAEESEAARE